MRDRFSQGCYRLVDALEMEGFLIAMRDVMEHRDGAWRLLLCIKQGEGAQGDVDRAPGRQLKHPGFVLETACHILNHKQPHDPGPQCPGWLWVVASLFTAMEHL